ncbi:MAG: hypothetical protein ABIQ13_11525 [Pedococcus sp.]
MPLVECECALADGSAGSVVGTLRVQVVDVSRADAASPVMASWVGPSVELVSGSAVSCSLEVPQPLNHAVYAVQAHLDLDGSGETSVGDYRTMEHVGVTPDMLGGRQRAKVRLRLVG